MKVLQGRRAHSGCDRIANSVSRTAAFVACYACLALAGSGSIGVQTHLKMTRAQDTNPGLASSRHVSQPKPWLDDAVMRKHCPSASVNVSTGIPDSDQLLARIAIAGDTLRIEGTPNPDHIVVRPGGAPGFVRVHWNGVHLGRFGPIARILVRGDDGDDVLVLEPGVDLPAILDGGSGDDCVQGGSSPAQLFGADGDDVLIAGTGRPALHAGSGSDRIVVPHRMGTVRFAPSAAHSELVQLLAGIYDVQPLVHHSRQLRNEAPSPVIVGSADLADQQARPLLAEARDAGQAVVLTNGTKDDAVQLRVLLGHPNTAKAPEGSKTGLSEGAAGPLVFFRKSPRPGKNAYDYSTGFVASLPNSLDDWTIALLSQIFSATAIVPEPPSDSPTNDLQRIANRYTSSAWNQDGNGNGVQIANSVWAVRSFLNQADFYYVLQEVDYHSAPTSLMLEDNTDSFIYSFYPTPTLTQTSPATTQCSDSTTSGMSWSVGGSTGWNQQQGLNAALTAGVSISDSQTITCPQTMITNMSDPGSGRTQWSYQLPNPLQPSLISFYNQWIWEVPFSDYQAGQDSIAFLSEAQQNGADQVTTDLDSSVPLPFGRIFELQKPTVLSVSPTCVDAGNAFAINGTGLYPSLVSSVLIGGTPLSPSQYTTASDTLVNVIAPEQSGEYLPIAVQTAQGESNSDVTIEISVLNLCSVDARKRPE